jgi:hypothetical protein
MSKRAIQMSFVKPEVQEVQEIQVDIPKLIKTAVREVSAGVCCYIAADICRKIILNKFGGK